MDRSAFKRFVRYAAFSTEDPSGRYAILAFWILLIILIYPYFAGSTLAQFVFSLLISFVLISAVFSITGRSKFAIMALVLIVPSLVIAWTTYFVESDALSILDRLISLAVLMLVTISILLEVVRSKSPIPRHVIWGAIAVYLLVGLNFALLFQLTELITPGSFYYSVAPSTVLGPPDFVYFSFVTLATLGYGDIVPITQQARSFAILEAVTGSLYLAVLIGKIVSLSISSSLEKAR